MNKFKLFIAIFLTYIIFNSFVFSDIVDGDSLLKSIRGSDHENIDSLSDFYEGYISGVADTTINANWCPPIQTKRSQLEKIISDYYKANAKQPGGGSVSAKDLIVIALAETYPCNK